jgi:hypothetical protein
MLLSFVVTGLDLGLNSLNDIIVGVVDTDNVRLVELEIYFKAYVDRMDTLFDMFTNLIDTLTRLQVEHYITYGEDMAFHPNVLNQLYSSPAFTEAITSLDRVVNELNIVRDSIYNITTEVEQNYPESIDSFYYEGHLYEIDRFFETFTHGSFDVFRF